MNIAKGTETYQVKLGPASDVRQWLHPDISQVYVSPKV